LDVTSICTTAGETCSKMSANDIGAPGGGANIGGRLRHGAPEVRTTWAGSAAPAGAHAHADSDQRRAGHARAGHRTDKETRLPSSHLTSFLTHGARRRVLGLRT
jgi:hypothetical protein